MFIFTLNLHRLKFTSHITFAVGIPDVSCDLLLDFKLCGCVGRWVEWSLPSLSIYNQFCPRHQSMRFFKSSSGKPAGARLPCIIHLLDRGTMCLS